MTMVMTTAGNIKTRAAAACNPHQMWTAVPTGPLSQCKSLASRPATARWQVQPGPWAVYLALDVRLHAFIIGHTGVMRQGNVNVLLELGVSLACSSLLPSYQDSHHWLLLGIPWLPRISLPGGGSSAPMLLATHSTASGERDGQD